MAVFSFGGDETVTDPGDEVPAARVDPDEL
jgi:hypothetical protein